MLERCNCLLRERNKLCTKLYCHVHQETVVSLIWVKTLSVVGVAVFLIFEQTFQQLAWEMRMRGNQRMAWLRC